MTQLATEKASASAPTVTPAALSAWLEANLRIHRGRATRAFLRQSYMRGGEERQSNVMPYALADDVEASELARMVWQDAQEDANDVGALCRYVLVLTDEAEQVLARKMFRASGRQTISADAQPEEAATADGVLHQLMRHMEVEKRISLGERDLAARLSERVFMQLEGMLDRAYKRNETLEDRELKTLQLFEHLSSHQHERELALLREKSALELKTRALNRLEPAIPAILNRIVGQPLAATDQHAAVDALVMSISPDQGKALAQHLTEEQRIALFALYTEAEERKKKREAAARKNGAAKADEPKSDGAKGST